MNLKNAVLLHLNTKCKIIGDISAYKLNYMGRGITRRSEINMCKRIKPKQYIVEK